jgi:hypothetical protein
VTATVVVAIVVAWAIHGTFELAMTSMFVAQNRGRDSIF